MLVGPLYDNMPFRNLETAHDVAKRGRHRISWSNSKAIRWWRQGNQSIGSNNEFLTFGLHNISNCSFFSRNLWTQTEKTFGWILPKKTRSFSYKKTWSFPMGITHGVVAVGSCVAEFPQVARGILSFTNALRMPLILMPLHSLVSQSFFGKKWMEGVIPSNIHPWSLLDGGNSNIFGIFTPKPGGNDSQFDDHIFQVGWNYQL